MKRGFAPDRDADRAVIAAVAEAHACANCGANAPDRYCPACGQDTRDRLPTFVQFMREATGRYLAFDGKLWKTLLPLLFRPGLLTRAYLAGKRRRFSGPARLILIFSLVLFAVLRFTVESMEIVGLDQAISTDASEAAEGAQPAANGGTKVDPDAGIDSKIDAKIDFGRIDLGDSVGGPLKKRIERFNRLPRDEKEQVIAGTTRYGPYAMFVLLPAFAVLLKLVYLGRRHRYPGRPRLYGEHLVFAAHNHAFLFTILIVLATVPVAPVRQLLAVWILVYLAWSTHIVYGGSWLGIALRGFALSVVYFVLFMIVTAALLIAAILLR